MHVSPNKLGQFDENPAFLGCFSKRSTHFLGCHMSKTTISSSRIWLVVDFWRPKLREISVRICSLKKWTPDTFKWHFSVLFCCAFMCLCLLMLCGPLLGKGWPFGSRLWCLIVKLLLSNWYPGSGVGLIVSIPDLCTLSYFHVFPRDNIRKPFTLCITQSLNSHIHFHLL